MEITEEQYVRIKDSLPVQRGNVSLTNLQFLNAVLYVAEHGCKWRGLPKRFGNWHTIYTRMNRWSKNGTLDRVFEKLQLEQIVRIRIEAFSLDSTIVKVHPDGTGALKKTDPSRSANLAGDGPQRFIWFHCASCRRLGHSARDQRDWIWAGPQEPYPTRAQVDEFHCLHKRDP